MWAKEIRQELNKQYPDMDFTTMARRLSELWGTVPNSERELWRRKAKREAAKKQKCSYKIYLIMLIMITIKRLHSIFYFTVKQDAPLLPSRKFINKKGGPIQPPLNNIPVAKPVATSPPENQVVRI